jgi:hypothetical protein
MQKLFESMEFPYIAADFDYFRIAREKWELFLTQLRQLGLQNLAITIPWGFHESERGVIDLNGATHPRRNLAALIELCQAFNFHCLLDFGPYCDKGILNQGLPAWLIKEAGPPAAVLPDAVKNWYTALSQALVSKQWPAGPIALVSIKAQPIHPLTHYSPQVTTVKWPIWLRKRYHGIEALNAAYGAAYRSVSEVDFPQGWSQEITPLEQDAKEFLAEVELESRQETLDTLTTAGWQIPIHLPTTAQLPSEVKAEAANLPPVKYYLLTDLAKDQHLPLDPDPAILILQQPIQVDPDPADVGQGPVWANEAPIRSDGSLRQTFWQIRAQIWQHTLSNVTLADEVLSVIFETSGLVSTGRDTTLKIDLPKDIKPTSYRLKLSGELQPAPDLKASRGKLSGSYLTEAGRGGAAQTDLALFLADPSSRLGGFILTYLQALLNGQAQTLVGCASLARTLSQTLTVQEKSPGSVPSAASTRPASYTLAEARRGLREADAILRRAMASIGGLEVGFETILGLDKPEMPQPAQTSAAISPEILEGVARETLIETGKVCGQIAPELKSAAETLQNVVKNPGGFTLQEYQQAYTTATATAETCRQRLLETIAKLRAEIAMETLPLVTWRVHDQVQSIAERLRWGVLRG